jgi:Zn-dependent M28 family amino/carboxypeptidase
VPAAVEQAAATITAASARAHVSVLAADSMLGRGTPSRGLMLSAAYIVDRFQRLGLEGAFAGSFLQPFSWPDTPEADWPANTGAVLRGSDPALAGDWVVVTAHYDHLGVVARPPDPDSIMNGADDNASGTAAVLEIARALAGLQARPGRTIAFVIFAGEEEGMIGSSWFVKHAPQGARLVADINLDMIGRNDPAMVYVCGDSLTSLGVNARELARHYPILTLRSIPIASAYNRSDQYPFALARIPALMFTAGENDLYHTPRDQVETLDADKIARVARLGAYMAYDVASRRDPPTWTAAGLVYAHIVR